MSDARRQRHARVALEVAFQALETALALGRDATEALAVLEAALAKPELEPGDRAKAASRRVELSAVSGVGAVAGANGATPANGANAAAAVLAGGGFAGYARAHGLGGVRMWTTSSGARVFRFVTESFPRHVNYVYLLEIDGQRVLWDCGSGLFSARAMILDGFALLEPAFGLKIAPADVDVLLVSHGHYDHFGDARWWKETARAPLWIHELDARVVENFEERTVVGGRDMAVWLAGAGCDDERVRSLVSMYLASKEMYSSVPVDRRLRHGQTLFSGRARLIHTPGHCPGHLCLRIDDVILVADQVLAPITPHLSPQALHPQNGLERYLAGLARLVKEDGIKTVLPAHYDEISDLRARVREIAEDHVDKLQKTLAVCRDGATVVDVARELFGKQEGYNVLLAILEAGTHVEYLHQLGSLAVCDLDAVVKDPRRPFRYRATEVVHADGFGVDLGGG